jgi:hypothetical protein
MAHDVIDCILTAHHVVLFREDASIVAGFAVGVSAAMLRVLQMRNKASLRCRSISSDESAAFYYHMF